MTRQTYKYISISVALVTGIATVFFIYFLKEKNKMQNPDKVLDEAKSYFMNITGSFILHEPYVDDNLYPNRLIFQGGITQIKNNQQVEYIFYADLFFFLFGTTRCGIVSASI